MATTPKRKPAAKKPPKATIKAPANKGNISAQKDMSEKKKVIAPVAEKIKKLPAAAKSAPKKIVERTLEATLKTVEKAAEKEAQKASKKAFKATVKAKKALRKMVNAKKAAQQAYAKAEASSAELNQGFVDVYANSENIENSAPELRKKKISVGAAIAASGIKNATTDVAKRAAREIKDKFRELIHPSEEKVFYYERRQIIALTLLYAIITYFVWLITKCLMFCGLISNLVMVWLLIITMTICLLALASVVFVLIFPQKLAVITYEGIKIDHNALLKWNDIEMAEEKYSSYMTCRPMIALHVKAEARDKYKLTFMQHLCKHNVFTPFSIPLYAMKPEDATEIKNIIKRHCKYQDSRS